MELWQRVTVLYASHAAPEMQAVIVVPVPARSKVLGTLSSRFWG
ncbi:hypothetical protein [Thermacetogenium phaeum]|nr:hypothetical protein [Thermacetogenium phaeum]